MRPANMSRLIFGAVVLALSAVAGSAFVVPTARGSLLDTTRGLHAARTGARPRPSVSTTPRMVVGPGVGLDAGLAHLAAPSTLLLAEASEKAKLYWPIFFGGITIMMSGVFTCYLIAISIDKLPRATLEKIIEELGGEREAEINRQLMEEENLAIEKQRAMAEGVTRDEVAVLQDEYSD